jgi:transglutaminase-like putative cysteine protease
MPSDDFRDYLASTEIVDWRDPRVLKRAQALAGPDALTTAAQCFGFVRDEIQHSWDYQRDPVTCNASDVLSEATGYCYAKSHLLAALLRANGLPAGFCYQRLTNDGPGTGFCLHGFNAVHLPEYGWYRIDPRGNSGRETRSSRRRLSAWCTQRTRRASSCYRASMPTRSPT